jgi:GxxExxY protein
MMPKKEPIPQEIEKVAIQIVDSAYKVHMALGPGLLESAYEHCLVHELKKRGLSVKTQVSMPIYYDGEVLNEGYRIDVLVEDSVIIEIKSLDSLLPVHKSQIITYLSFSGLRLGFLMNFNTKMFTEGIQRIAN